MGIRVNKLLTELNIGLTAFDNLLKALGYKENILTANTKIPDDIAILARVMFAKDTDYTKIIKAAADKGIYGGAFNNLKWFNILFLGRCNYFCRNNSCKFGNNQVIRSLCNFKFSR